MIHDVRLIIAKVFTACLNRSREGVKVSETSYMLFCCNPLQKKYHSYKFQTQNLHCYCILLVEFPNIQVSHNFEQSLVRSDTQID